MFPSMRAVTLAVALLSEGIAAQYTYTQSYNGTVGWENAILRPNGDLLLVSLQQPYVYNLNVADAKPELTVVATLPNSTFRVQGIASIGTDKYAVSCGISGADTTVYVNESIYTIDMSTASANGTVEPEFILENDVAQNFNGMISLTSDDNIVMIGDSILGLVWRVDIAAKTMVAAIEDELMAVPVNTTYEPALGIDGLKQWTNTTDGQTYLYFTSVAGLSLARVSINANGTAATAAATIVEQFTGTDNWDDFGLAQDSGLIFGAQSPGYVNMVTIATGAQDVVINSTDIDSSAIVLKGDGSTGYAIGRGGNIYTLVLPAY